MKINGLKLTAALFVFASIIALYLNDFKYNIYVFILNVIGIALFIIALIKNAAHKAVD